MNPNYIVEEKHISDFHTSNEEWLVWKK